VEPTVVGDILYVGSCAGRFYAFENQTGDVLWTFDVSQDGAEQFHGTPLIADSIIVFGTDEGSQGPGTLYALDRRTGELIWKSGDHYGMATEPAIGRDSLVFAVTRDDSLLALNLHSGEPVWSFFSGWYRSDESEYESMIAIPKLMSSPLIMDDWVIMVGRNNVIYKLRMNDGAVEDSISIVHIVTSDPVVVGKKLLLGLSNHTLATYDPTNNMIDMLCDLPYMALGGMAVSDERIVFLAGYEDDRPANVVSIDRSDCELVWDVFVDDDDSTAFWYVPRVHVWRDWIIVGSTTGRVVLLDAGSGDAVGEFSCDNPVRGIGHSDSLLFVGTFNGLLYALSVPD
jgi:outer membrane protein assembly factor BamB